MMHSQIKAFLRPLPCGQPFLLRSNGTAPKVEGVEGVEKMGSQVQAPILFVVTRAPALPLI